MQDNTRHALLIFLVVFGGVGIYFAGYIYLMKTTAHDIRFYSWPLDLRLLGFDVRTAILATIVAVYVGLVLVFW